MLRRSAYVMGGLLGVTTAFVGYKQLSRPRLVWTWSIKKPWFAPTDSKGNQYFEATYCTHSKSELWNTYIKHSSGLWCEIRFQPQWAKVVKPENGPWAAHWSLSVWPSRIDTWLGKRYSMIAYETGNIQVDREDLEPMPAPIPIDEKDSNDSESNRNREHRNTKNAAILTSIEAVDKAIVKHCPKPLIKIF